MTKPCAEPTWENFEEIVLLTVAMLGEGAYGVLF
jgi:hypothetical protein